MHCPYCRHTDTRVVDSRVAEDGSSIRRRRTCSDCGKRFTTVELMQVSVLKRSGATEPFQRDKAVAGVRKACKGRPVTEDQLDRLGQDVEDALRAAGAAEVPAHEVGLAILGPLRDLDEVAYLRFASVYRAFESVDDFEHEIAALRAERTPVLKQGTVAEAHAPVVDEQAPVSEAHAPVVEAHAPVVEAHAPVVEAHAPVVEERAQRASRDHDLTPAPTG